MKEKVYYSWMMRQSIWMLLILHCVASQAGLFGRRRFKERSLPSRTADQTAEARSSTPNSEFPDLVFANGVGWGRTSNGGLAPIPVVNGRISVSGFPDSVAAQLQNYYEKAFARGWSHPLAQTYVEERNLQATAQTSSENQTADAPTPIQSHERSTQKGLGPPPERSTAPPPAVQATQAALPYINPLPYPEKYRQCEEKYLTNQCRVDKGSAHYALMGEMDPTLCSSDKVSVISHTLCFAKANLNFEHCIADLPPLVGEPKCKALLTDFEPNLRKAAVRNCRAKALTWTCPPTAPLDVVQCEIDIQTLTADASTPPLRQTHDDSCTTAGRMSYSLCRIRGRVADTEGKQLQCKRVGKATPPFSIFAIDKEREKRNLATTPKNSPSPNRVFFDLEKNTKKDFQIFEACLLRLFGRENVTTFPRGHEYFIVRSRYGLQALIDAARAGGECAYTRKRLTSWDGGAAKISEMGPWGVANESVEVIGSDFGS